jgi:acyl-coenzyme A synthetase/AMP-(fatty) acid ligase
MIKSHSRGQELTPKEVENMSSQLPGASEVAVIGVLDAVQGQAIKGIIVPRVGSFRTVTA